VDRTCRPAPLVLPLLVLALAGAAGSAETAGEAPRTFPPSDCCWRGKIRDPDISDARVAEYLKMPGVKGISTGDGVLEVEIDDPPIDPRMRLASIQYGWSTICPGRSAVAGDVHPFVSGAAGPREVRIHERQAAPEPGPEAWSFFIPGGLLVARKKPGPPGGAPLPIFPGARRGPRGARPPAGPPRSGLRRGGPGPLPDAPLRDIQREWTLRRRQARW